MHDRVADVFYQRVLPQLTDLFDSVGGDSHSITIHSLSLDCGEIAADAWEAEFAERLLNLVTRELQGLRFHQEETLPQQEAEYQWITDCIHFLTKGTFEWDIHREPVADFEKRFQSESPLLDELALALHSSEDAMKRLFHYFSADFRRRLSDAFVCRLTDVDADYILQLRQAGVRSTILENAVIRAYAVAVGNPTRPSEFFVALTAAVLQEADPDTQLSVVRSVRSFLRKKPSFVTDEVRNWPISRPDVADNPLDEVFYVANAGLVLMHPFVGPLLKNIGFVGDDIEFTNERRSWAAILLQHLVSASPAVKEQSLALNKVLSGLQPESFVNPEELERTERISKECDEVLCSVISHWSVLGNTSIDGLRETFLQRAGKLIRTEDRWLLQVDSRGVDVLLSSLPWSIGIVKLPWMDRILYVEWT